MIDGVRRALVLAPHTDDGEFGCGGTMARLVEAGSEVRYVAFSIATRSLPPGFAPDTLAREVRDNKQRTFDMSHNLDSNGGVVLHFINPPRIQSEPSKRWPDR